MTDCPTCAQHRADMDLLHDTAATLAHELGGIRDAFADLRECWPDLTALERVIMASTTCSNADLAEVQRAAHVLSELSKITKGASCNS